jgi:hypothetical protein
MEGAAAPDVVVPPSAVPPTGAPQEDAPPAAPPRPESPVTYDETLGKWVAKTKVDGTERVIPWDELHRDAQLAKSAEERFKEAKAIKLRNELLERAALTYQEALKNPQRAFDTWQALGLDPHAMLEQLYSHAEAEAKLTPEQRELRAYREQRAAAEQAEQQRLLQEQEKAQQEEQSIQDARYERAFVRGMAAAGVPDDPILRGHLSHMLWAMHDRASEQGQTMSIQDAVSEALGSMKSITKSVVSMMSPEERVAFLGADVVDALVASKLVGAAPIPASVHHSSKQPRHDDGKFSPHTVVRPGSNFFGR